MSWLSGYHGCQIKKASRSHIVLGQWPHPCEIMQGNSSFDSLRKSIKSVVDDFSL